MDILQIPCLHIWDTVHAFITTIMVSDTLAKIEYCKATLTWTFKRSIKCVALILKLQRTTAKQTMPFK